MGGAGSWRIARLKPAGADDSWHLAIDPTMSIDLQGVLIIAALVVLALWMLGAHNRVTGLRGSIVVAWDLIDPLLRRRAQILKALVETLREQLADEKGSFDAAFAAQGELDSAMAAVSRKRASAVSVQTLAVADAALTTAMTRLHSLGEQAARSHDAEDGGVSTRAALAELAEIEPRLRFARQSFNDAVTAYNQAIVQFPTRLLMSLFSFEPGSRW
jgi:LemA protein